jgi:predicted RNase H-like nuclease (RuvC/YqgF family)
MSTDLKAERLRSSALEQTTSCKEVLVESKQSKVKSLEHACDQLRALLDWEKNSVQKYINSQSTMEKKLDNADTEISDSKKALDEKQETVESLSRSFPLLKR